MADVTADLITTTALDGYSTGVEDIYNTNQQFPANIQNQQIVSLQIPILIPTIRDVVPGPSTTTYYFMRARDPDCGVITYRYWIVANQADANATQYTGSKCGGSALVEITVERTWTVTN